MQKAFPHRWYWLADDGRIYSAKDQALVSADDSGYKAFLANGKKPAPWPLEGDFKTQSMASLADLLTNRYGLHVTREDALHQYTNDKYERVAHGGIAVNVAPLGKKPVVIEVKTDAKGLALLNTAMTTAAINPAAVLHWGQRHGGLDLSATQIKTMFAAVQAHIDGSAKTRSQVLAAIKDGSVTTETQIDRPPAPIPAWPLNS